MEWVPGGQVSCFFPHGGQQYLGHKLNLMLEVLRNKNLVLAFCYLFSSWQFYEITYLSFSVSLIMSTMPKHNLELSMTL